MTVNKPVNIAATETIPHHCWQCLITFAWIELWSSQIQFENLTLCTPSYRSEVGAKHSLRVQRARNWAGRYGNEKIQAKMARTRKNENWVFLRFLTFLRLPHFPMKWRSKSIFLHHFASRIRPWVCTEPFDALWRRFKNFKILSVLAIHFPNLKPLFRSLLRIGFQIWTHACEYLTHV